MTNLFKNDKFWKWIKESCDPPPQWWPLSFWWHWPWWLAGRGCPISGSLPDHYLISHWAPLPQCGRIQFTDLHRPHFWALLDYLKRWYEVGNQILENIKYATVTSLRRSRRGFRKIYMRFQWGQVCRRGVRHENWGGNMHSWNSGLTENLKLNSKLFPFETKYTFVFFVEP